MKKFLSLAMILGAGIVAVPSIEAKSTAGTPAMSDPQLRIQIGRNRRYGGYRRMRTFTTTRIVHRGFRTYRETIRTIYFPDGTSRTEIIDRERIRY
jgi:hypothetical protein